MSIDNTTGRTGSMAQIPAIGAGFAPAFTLSGDIWLGMFNITSSVATQINFPYLTRFVEITNHTSQSALRIAATQNAANNINQSQDKHYVLSGSSGPGSNGPPKFGPFELRMNTIWLQAELPIGTPGGNGSFIRAGVLAGLTTIPAKMYP